MSLVLAYKKALYHTINIEVYKRNKGDVNPRGGDIYPKYCIEVYSNGAYFDLYKEYNTEAEMDIDFRKIALAMKNGYFNFDDIDNSFDSLEPVGS